MTNILNWPDYKVLQVSELEHDYQVNAEVSEPPTHCPHCNHPEIVGFGRRDVVVMATECWVCCLGRMEAELVRSASIAKVMRVPLFLCS